MFVELKVSSNGGMRYVNANHVSHISLLEYWDEIMVYITLSGIESDFTVCFPKDEREQAENLIKKIIGVKS